MVPYIVTDNTVSIMVDGDMKVITDSHMNYTSIRKAIADERFDDAISLIDVAKEVSDFGGGLVTVKGGIVYYGEQGLHNSLTSRILKMKEEGFNISPMAKFLENLMQNPSNRAVTELYGFLEYGDLPITDDGHFLAYKMVREDFTDCHSGKFDNSPGKVVEVRRNEVDEDKDRTCSYGLHFCSQGYLGHYGGQKVVILKINPKDVVSIPSDYNNTKGRCCRYEVLREAEKATNSTSSDSEFDTSVAVTTQDVTADGAPFNGVTFDGETATALFTMDEAAERLCSEAVDPRGALRKRISRKPEMVEGDKVRCQLTRDEYDDYDDYQELQALKADDDYDDDDDDYDDYNYGGGDYR